MKLETSEPVTINSPVIRKDMMLTTSNKAPIFLYNVRHAKPTTIIVRNTPASKEGFTNKFTLNTRLDKSSYFPNASMLGFVPLRQVAGQMVSDCFVERK